MENPEEVLQALDEFQKMRPTEIPRELEEYLCWVAKTGDPVYQWSLIKALFREKLTRVMTEFYESCPSLDLAPCPNVETFNYDIMKSSLLERLESFANAPFTVQRICELLTSPRKEYNRVDKFMRAIEKNILVVSTKEPGSTIRRSENGDGMVNGSVEDDVPGGDSHEVEMDSWVKDCASSTVGISATVDNEARLLDDVTTSIPKNGPASNGESLLPQEKTEHATVSTCEPSALSFVPSTSEFSGQGSESRDSMSTGLVAQSSSPLVHEAPSIVREVPEAIMNEDTSSQPSLDMDSPETEQADPIRKLQTTFQAKDFITHEKSPEPFEKNAKVTEKDEESEEVNKVPTVENSSQSLDACEKLKPSMEEKESVLPIMEKFLQANSRLEKSVITSEGTPSDQKPAEVPEFEKSDLPKEEKDFDSEISTCEEQGGPLAVSTPEQQPPSPEKIITEEKICDESEVSTCAPVEEKQEIPTKVDVMEDEEPKEKMIEEPIEECNEPVFEEIKESSKEENTESEEPSIKSVTEESKPIIEETSSEKTDGDDCSQDSENSNLTIEETTEDSSEPKSMVPDPIPIIEEPKEVEPVVKYSEKETLIEEIDSKTESAKTEPAETVNLPKNEPAIAATVENIEAKISEELPARTEEPVKTKISIEEEKVIPEIVPEVIPEKESSPTESMEVDGEESAKIFQEDEPMEEEVSEVASS